MKMYIGKNIRHQRELQKMTQSELAEKLGVSSKLVWSWEANRTEPKAAHIQKMLEIFGCTSDELCAQIDLVVDYSEYLIIEGIRKLPLKERAHIKAYVDYICGKKE